MTDFVRLESVLPRIPTLLPSRVVGFREAPEYRQLRDDEQAIPGVVCAAFGKFLLRLQLDPDVSPSSDELRSAYQVLERLALAPETAVQDLLMDEIFESIEHPSLDIARVKRALLPNTLALYMEWMGQRHSEDR